MLELVKNTGELADGMQLKHEDIVPEQVKQGAAQAVQMFATPMYPLGQDDKQTPLFAAVIL